MRKRCFILLFLSCLFMFSSCRSLFEDEYLVVNDHVDEYVEVKNNSQIQSVRNYAGMKSAILNLVNNAADYGMITTKDYIGSPQDDISRACLEVTRETPLGVYAIDYMSHTCTQILTYFEIEVFITFKRSAEDILSLASVTSKSAFFELIDKALSERSGNVSAYLASTFVTEQEISEYIQSYYENHLLLMLEPPELSIKEYPSSNGIQNIVTVDFKYRESDEEYNTVKAALIERLQELLTPVFAQTDEAKMAEAICGVIDSIGIRSETGNMVSDLLLNGQADSRGFALTYKLFCDLVGIECQVVSGRFGSQSHFWNIVKISSSYYHVDSYYYNSEALELTMLKNDSELLGLYWWDTEQYPPCDGEPLYEAPEEPETSALMTEPSDSGDEVTTNDAED